MSHLTHPRRAREWSPYFIKDWTYFCLLLSLCFTDDWPYSETLGIKPGRFKSWSDLGSPLVTRTPKKGTTPEGCSLAPPRFSLLCALAAVTPTPSCLKSADLAESLYTLVLPGRQAQAQPWQWWYIRNTVRKPILPSSMGTANLWHLSFVMLISRLSIAPMRKLHHVPGTRIVSVENLLGNSDLQLWDAVSQQELPKMAF